MLTYRAVFAYVYRRSHGLWLVLDAHKYANYANQTDILAVSLFVTSAIDDPAIDISLVDVDDRLGCLHSVSLDVQRGRLHLIVGSNGGGKTQLLRILAGVETPTRGEVLTVRSRIFLGDQSLHASETIADAIARYELRTEIRADTERLLEKLSLPVLATPVDRLSSGQRQRVLLLLALGTTADIVLLDSPTMALDAVGRELATTVMEAIVADGRTVVAATVDPELLVLTDSKRIWVGDGRVEMQGDEGDVPALKLINGGRTGPMPDDEPSSCGIVDPRNAPPG